MPNPPFQFLRLPAELRLQIYRYHVVQSAPIELWPHVQHNVQDNCNLQRATTMRIYRRKIQPQMGLCRVNKLIHKEATQVFYGENEWKFTGINGWIVFSCWLHTIGSTNFRWLKHISLHISFPGRDYVAFPTQETVNAHERICTSTNLNSTTTASRGNQKRLSRQRRHFRMRMRRIGLCVPDQWSYEHSLQHSVSLLIQHCTLKTFHLVHPPTYFIHHNSARNAWFWEQLTFLYQMMVQKCEKECLWPPEWRWVFLKHSVAKYQKMESSVIARVFQPWLRRYSGECQRLMQTISARPWLGKICYAISIDEKRGAYRLVEWEEYLKFCRNKAVERDERNDEDWINF